MVSILVLHLPSEPFARLTRVRRLISRPIRGKKPLAPILDLLVHEAGYFGHQLILDLLEAESRRPLDLQRVLEAAAEGGQVALLRSTLEKLPGEPSGELVASLLKLALVKVLLPIR